MPPPAVRKYLFWVGIPLLLAALYALAGFLLVPRLVRSRLQGYVAEHYHRRAEVGEVRFNPFTLTLDVHSFALADADAQPLLSFSRLLVDLDMATLWRRGPGFAQIALDDPFARVLIRTDGSLNLADLAKPRPREAAPAPEPANSKPMRLFIDRFTVRGGRTTFEDRTRAQPTAGINESAKLTATAKVSPQSGALSADVELTQFNLPVFQPYLAKQTQLTLLSGQLATKLHIDRAADGALNVDGDTDVTKLRTIDNDYKRDFISWDRVRVQKMRYRSAPASLQIASLLAQAPYARVIIAKDRTVNASDALRPAGAAPTTDSVSNTAATRSKSGGAPTPAAPLDVSIGTVRCSNGSATFADLWIQPNFAVGIQT
ncbi:MAG: DUF748 domain-containing protein [Gammaproteobacteria bacterium]